MSVKGVLDKEGLVVCLAKLGIAPSSHIMVHASLSSLGFIDGGAQTLVSAMREAVGPDGALIVPSFRFAIRSDKYTMTQCKDCGPRPLCPSREEGDTGIVGEAVREQPDSLRSCNPSHTWVGIGGDARFILEGHYKSFTPCGSDSPFFRLVERDGKILLLGVGVNSFTNWHAVEDVRAVPYMGAYDGARRHATYTTNGRRLQYVYPEFLHTAMKEAGIIKSGRMGAGTALVIPARDLASFMWVITEDDPWCLVLRPRGDQYDPFADAAAKMMGMVRAWRANPGHEAWRLLLEESERCRPAIYFEPAENPAVNCPAYRGVVRGYHRCAANDVPPWEKYEDYPVFEPGVATCDRCNWPLEYGASGLS